MRTIKQFNIKGYTVFFDKKKMRIIETGVFFPDKIDISHKNLATILSQVLPYIEGKK